MNRNDYQLKYEIFKESIKMVNFNELEDAKSLIFGLIDHKFDKNDIEPLLESKQVQSCKKVGIPTMFQCIDCFYDKDVALCYDCFDEKLHKNHEVRVIQIPQYCGCGNLSKMKYEGMCDQHKTPHQEQVLNDKQIEFIQNVKMTLEVVAYHALSLIEYVLFQPLISGSYKLATAMFRDEMAKKSCDAMNSLRLLTKILSYLSELQQFQQVVVDILLSQIPIELQKLGLFRHDHNNDIFYFEKVFKKDELQICTCSVWKNLLRYFKYVGSDEQNLTNLLYVIQDLHIKHSDLARIYVEMLPFQFQWIQQIVYQQALFFFLSRDSDDYKEFKEQIKSSQLGMQESSMPLLSNAFKFQKYFSSTILLELGNYQGQVKYLTNLKYFHFISISKYTRQGFALIASLPYIITKHQAQICCEQLLTQQFNYFELFIQIVTSFSAIFIYDKEKFYKYSNLQYSVLASFKNQFRLILQVAGQNKQWITQKLIKTMINKSILQYNKYDFIDYVKDKDHLIIDTHVQSDAIISNILIYFYLLTQPKDSSQFKQLLLQTLDLELEVFNKFFYDFMRRNVEYKMVKIQDYDCIAQFREAITIYLYTFGAQGYIKFMKYIDSIDIDENVYKLIIEIYYDDLSLLPSIEYFEQNQEIDCLIRQLLNQMYFFSKYLTYDQVKDNLNLYDYEVPKDILLSQLDLNKETYQLSLKGNLSYNAFLKMDEDQLDQAEQKDQFIVFGNQLDFEMKDKEHKTLTRLRKQLIDDIFNGDNQILTYVMHEIEDQHNIMKSIFFINLIVTASQQYQLEQSAQQIINQIKTIICECKIENKKLVLLQKKIKQQIDINEQDKQKYHLQDKKINKLDQYKQLYQKKQQQVDLNIDQQQEQGDIQVCDICRLEFKKQPILRLKYLQFNNNLKYLQYQDKEYLRYLNNESAFQSEIQLTGCQHQFHQHCYPQEFKIVDDIVFQCQVCKRVGNMIIQVHNVNCDILYYYQQLNKIFKQSENIQYHENFRKMDSNYYEILLQIYLNYIRKMVDSIMNVQEVEEFNQILQNFNTKELKSSFLNTINKYTSPIFQIMNLILQGDFNLNQHVLNLIRDRQSMVNIFTQHIKRPICKNVEKLVNQYSNILYLQQLLKISCYQCDQFATFRCLLCNLNFCGSFIGIQQSCYNIHSIICHNSKLCIIYLFNGQGYVVYNQRIGRYPKLLYKNTLGEQYQEDEVTKRNEFVVDRKMMNEFLEVQISDKHINYI